MLDTDLVVMGSQQTPPGCPALFAILESVQSSMVILSRSSEAGCADRTEERIGNKDQLVAYSHLTWRQVGGSMKIPAWEGTWLLGTWDLSGRDSA